MNIFLIRHGQTNWNELGKIQGSIDIELNEKGIQEAKNRADFFVEKNIIPDVIYSSNKKRAYKTASIIGEKFNLDPIQSENLSEINFGNWEGMCWKDLKNSQNEDFKKWLMDKKYSKVHGGESYDFVSKRFFEELKKIIFRESDKQNVFIVSHGLAIMAFRMEILKRDWSKNNLDLILDNLGYICYESNEILNMEI